MEMMKDYTYMVQCSDGSFYTGWTNDIKNRIRIHNMGKGAKYTKSRLPVKLVYLEEHRTKQEAMQREYAIKKLTRKEKLKLIADLKEGIHYDEMTSASSHDE